MSRSARAPSSRAICRSSLLVDAIKQKKPLPVGFYNAGTQVVTADSVDMANNLPSVTFAQLQTLAADPAATAAYYKPWSDSVRSADWPSGMQPDRGRVRVSTSRYRPEGDDRPPAP